MVNKAIQNNVTVSTFSGGLSTSLMPHATHGGFSALDGQPHYLD